MKINFAIFLIAAVSGLQCGSLVNAEKEKQAFAFKQLSFHSGRCNGSCPDLYMNVYSDKSIELARTIFKGKSQTDSAASGNFKGSLTDSSFSHLMNLLNEINWDTLSVPSVLCCDRPVKTIILRYNNERKVFKSMDVPASTLSLINYLTELGTNMNFPRYSGQIEIEDPAIQ